HPGLGGRQPGAGYDEATWGTVAENLGWVLARCRARGYEPAFHNETGTNVEGAAEIEQLLARTDVHLCLDVGHFAVAGGDPVAFLRRWHDRIDHLHLKDVLADRIAAIVADGEPSTAIWRREAFPCFGAGDVDLDDVLRVAADLGFAGWVVVEQDFFPSDAARFDQAIADQRANRAYLAERGWLRSRGGRGDEGGRIHRCPRPGSADDGRGRRRGAADRGADRVQPGVL